jgi:hypothetical protein
MKFGIPLILALGLTACGGVSEVAVPDSGILGAYAKAYNTTLMPKIKDLNLDGTSERDFDTATQELKSFNRLFFDSLPEDVYPLKDEPCVYHENFRRCWQIIREYALLISFDDENYKSEYTDSGSGKKLYNGDTIFLSAEPTNASGYASCFLTDGKLGENPIFWGKRVADKPESSTQLEVCDLANGALNAGVTKEKLGNVKVVVALESFAFTSARVACSERDCVEEQVKTK